MPRSDCRHDHLTLVANAVMDDAPAPFPLQKLQTGEVTSCDINANYLLAVGSRDKSVRILEWKIGLGFVDMFYSPLTVHKYAVTSVRFSPKGTMLASASLDGTAVLIDVLTGTKIFTMVQYNTANIKFCEFTFDCRKLITAAEDGLLCFWDLVHHRQIRHCRLHEDDYDLRGLAVSPDSEYLLSIDSGNLLKVWCIGEVIFSQPRCFFQNKHIHEDVLCCEFSPVKNVTGGALLKLGYCVATCGSDGLVKVWELIIESRPDCEANCHLRLLHNLRHSNDILSVRFNHKGNYIVSTGLNNLVKLWELHSGKCLKTLRGHARYVTSAVFSKDSVLLATGSIDKTLIVWDVSQNLTIDSELSIPCNVSCHFTNINLVSNQSGRRVTGQAEKYNEFVVMQKLTFPSIINSVRFQGDDALAVTGGPKTVTIWKREADKYEYEQKETLKEHECNVNDLDVSPCGNKIISCSVDGMMIFWDLKLNLPYKMKTPNCTGSLRTCKFSPDSNFIVAAGDDQKVYLWDANNLEFIKIMRQHEDAVTAVAFTADGEFLIITCGSDIILRNFKESEDLAKVSNAHDLGVLCSDFSSAVISETGRIYSTDGEVENAGMYLLATGGNDSLVKLWKISRTGIFSWNFLSGHGGIVNHVKFSPAEPFTLASCSSDTTIRIWDTKSKGCLHILTHHTSAVTTCSFSKDSSLFATGSLDKTVLILNVTERSCHEPTGSDADFNKPLEKWTSSDIANWCLDIGNPEVAVKIEAVQLSGRKLLSTSDDSIMDLFGLWNEREQKEVKFTLLSLKKSLGFPSDTLCEGKNIPHTFLCPLTHQMMKDPVICTDGYTYDRAAITEWFLSGKLISPVTKECLATTKLLPYSALKINIYKFLHDCE